MPNLEITPGVNIFSDNTDYTTTVSDMYLIQSERGNSLLISDVTGHEEIVLGGATNITITPTLTEFSTSYKTFSDDYPNFPTTQSAPFKTRIAIANSSNTPLFNVSLANATPSFGAQPATNASTATIDGTVIKSAPVPSNIHWVPPQGSGKFGLRTSGTFNGEWHNGVDLIVPSGTQLIAPIDGSPVFYNDHSDSAGIYLVFLGVDNWCHTFVHLSRISEDVKIAAKKYMANPVSSNLTKYTVGQTLGATGNTGSHTTKPHLHWEVFNSVKVAQPNNVREIARKQTAKGVYEGQMVYIDPMAWFPKGIDGKQVQISIGPAQLPAYANLNNNLSYDRPTGIEIGLTPGAEQIYLRHSSGAYLGFDPDGNFKVFTPGSAEFKVNRNLVFDVLGGIFHSCMALYNRARQVIKSYAGAGFTSKAQGMFIDFLPKTEQLVAVQRHFRTEHIPAIFTRIDVNRRADIIDALRQSTSNVYYTLASGLPGASLDVIMKNGYTATPDAALIEKIKWDGLDSLDSLITTAVNNYKPNFSGNKIANLITPSLVKAIILLSSQGSANLGVDDTGQVGVFKLSQAAISWTKQDNLIGQLGNYSANDINIDIGVQFLFKRAQSMYDFLGPKLYNIYADSEAIGTADALKAVLMDFIFCIYANNVSTTIENMYRVSVEGTGTASYPALESAFANSSFLNESYGNYILCYVATVKAIENDSRFHKP